MRFSRRTGQLSLSVSVSASTATPASHSPYPEVFSFFGSAIKQETMNLSFPNNPSPGSSVFDFPAHRESTYVVQTPQDHARASSTSAPYTGDPGSYIVISGGTGCNPICSAFGPDACYVLPISDDGGSSSEIIRVLGGPSIGVYLSPSK